MTPKPRTPRPSVPPHAFVESDLPADFTGRRMCNACSKPGRYGDVQHPPGALPLGLPIPVPAPAGSAEIQARILGEARDG